MSPKRPESPNIFTQVRRQLVEENGFAAGTDLEDEVALLLARLGQGPEQQYRIGRYRVDFAWPEQKIALEADGWWHRSPEGSARDRERDSWLRSQGWVVFRVDDEHGPDVLAEQVRRVSRFARSEEKAMSDRDYRRMQARAAAKLTPAQQRARLGGLTKAALGPDRRDATQPARDARLQRYRDKVLAARPELAGDKAEVEHRAEQLRRADMQRMSMKAAAARRKR
jgi:hypothetical protein